MSKKSIILFMFLILFAGCQSTAKVEELTEKPSPVWEDCWKLENPDDWEECIKRNDRNGEKAYRILREKASIVEVQTVYTGDATDESVIKKIKFCKTSDYCEVLNLPDSDPRFARKAATFGAGGGFAALVIFLITLL